MSLSKITKDTEIDIRNLVWGIIFAYTAFSLTMFAVGVAIGKYIL
jgi:hypothetical protein